MLIGGVSRACTNGMFGGAVLGSNGAATTQCEGGLETNLQLFQFVSGQRFAQISQVGKEVVLAWLSKRESICGNALLEPCQARDFPAVRKERHPALDLDWTVVKPIGNEVAVDWRGGPCGGKHRSPRICWRHAAASDCRCLAGRDVEANCMAFVAMHASFALFQVDRIARQIPVVEPMAVRMEVESFLSDRCGRQHERPERRVKGITYAAQAGRRFFFVAIVGEPHGESAPHGEPADTKSAGADPRIVDLDLRRKKGNCPTDSTG